MPICTKMTDTSRADSEISSFTEMFPSTPQRLHQLTAVIPTVWNSWAQNTRKGNKRWRPEPELNRCTRFCKPLHNHSAIGPPVVGVINQAPPCVNRQIQNNAPNSRRKSIQAVIAITQPAGIPQIGTIHQCGISYIS